MTFRDPVKRKLREVDVSSWDGCTDLIAASASSVSAVSRTMQTPLFRRPPDPVRGRADAAGEAKPPASPSPQPEASGRGTGEGLCPDGAGLPL